MTTHMYTFYVLSISRVCVCVHCVCGIPIWDENNSTEIEKISLKRFEVPLSSMRNAETFTIKERQRQAQKAWVFLVRIR